MVVATPRKHIAGDSLGTRIGLILAGVLLANGAVADTLRNEITTFGGYRFGGSFDLRDTSTTYDLDDAASYGVIFNRSYDATTQWEIIYARQDTEAVTDAPGSNEPRVDIDVQLLELGGTYLWAGGRVQPYLAATIGGARVTTRARATESDTFLSGSIGAGVRIAPGGRLGLRLETRYHAVLTDEDTDLFCRTGPEFSVCAIRIEASILGQVATYAGVTFRF